MSKIMNPGAYKYRDYGIYLYEKDGEKKALVFFSGVGMKTHFSADTYDEVYKQAVSEINRYLSADTDVGEGK